MVDNCYGEFTELIEPVNVGADLMVGSLIKNPGGGLAPTGGYICGRADLIERCARRLTAPGLGREVGANLGLLTQFYQGFFLAPTVVASAVKGAVFAANCYEKLGFHVIPGASEVRHDIIQAPSARVYRPPRRWTAMSPRSQPLCRAMTATSSWPPVLLCRAAP